jgi:polyhydroxyalkanoate synthesis regulator phasin
MSGDSRRNCSAATGMSVRTCEKCTYENEDPKSGTCAMCGSLLPSVQPTQQPTCSMPTSASASAVTCGWPLDDGRICTYSAAQQTVSRHQREVTAHSKYRAQLASRASQSQAGLFGKRQRSDESTSTTRSVPPPPPAAAPAPAAVTSSTRTIPSPPPAASTAQTRNTFDEFTFDGSATTTEGNAYTERLEREQASLHQERAQQEGLKLMASIAQAAAEAATAALSGQVQALTEQLRSLPADVARDIPAAVRDHDEAEALRRSSEATDSSLQKQIMAAATCAEIGKLPGFVFVAEVNRIKCQDCFRYSSSKHCPGDLRRGARDAGWFMGPDETRVARADRPGKSRQRRPMSTVCWEVSHHCRAGSLHEWCVVFAAEQRKITSRSMAAGMVCASLVYQNIWEHDSYRSFERRIAGQHGIGTYVGTKMQKPLSRVCPWLYQLHILNDCRMPPDVAHYSRYHHCVASGSQRSSAPHRPTSRQGNGGA